MRKAKGLIIALAAAVIGLTAVSCAKEETTLRFNNATMGNIVNGVFVSDQGNRFNITEQGSNADLESMKRAFIICDVLRKTENSENEYDVRLKYIASVLEKEAKAVSEIENLDTYMNDPLVLHDFWFSGGYINIYVSLPVKTSGGKKHELNLLHEKKDGVYRFIIRHNAEGEIIKENGDNSDLAIGYAYASFPISSIIKEETATMEIELNQYQVFGEAYSAKSDIVSYRKEYKRSEFQHAN